MKLSPSEKDSIIALMTRLYFDILEIETEHRLLAGEGDFRARIEYFHDAVRALSEGGNVGTRLDVEWLAYDLQCLRYLQAMPLASFKPHQHPLSPHQDIVEVKPNSLTPKAPKATRAVRLRLVELYQYYGVLFAALLKPTADEDFHVRSEADMHDMQSIETILAAMEKKGAGQEIADMVRHMEDDDLRQQIAEILQEGSLNKKNVKDKLAALLASKKKEKKKGIATVEKGHMDYALAQLGMYEDSKETVKKMAATGMNLAGRFVENAMAETRREMGR